jgi:cytochrome c peroxidase
MVPSLKHVLKTAPYMHDGSIGSLTEVVAQYNAGGSGHQYTDGRIEPLGLSATEQEQLVSFLETL